MINLNPRGEVPLYEQIYAHIRTEIQRGQLSMGERLPSTRALARYLQVSRSTVVLAYEQLLSEGYIESVSQKGFFVAKLEGFYTRGRKKEVERRKEEGKIEYLVDFSPRGVDLSRFPYRIWRKLSKEVLLEDQAEVFRIGNPQGEYELREGIARHLYRGRGMDCDPGQVVVAAGSDCVFFILSLLLEKTKKIGFENPAYLPAVQMSRGLGYETASVEMDEQGMLVEALRESEAEIAYVTPSHQFPTGAIMPVARKLKLLGWAMEKEGRYIIEDDYDSEFRYRGKPIPALQSYDYSNKVIYLGTFSKSIAPGIRFSYMVLPKDLLPAYLEKASFIHSTVSQMDQRILCRFLEEGYYERHLNRMRALYKGRHDVLLESLKSFSDCFHVSGAHSGVHLTLTLKKRGWKEEELIEQAGEQGVCVYGISKFEIGRRKKEQVQILLGYGMLKEEEIQLGIERLKLAWKEVLE